MTRALLVFTWVLLLMPVSAYAAAEYYTCVSNFPDLGGTASCSGTTITFPNTTDSWARKTTVMTWPNSTTKYVSFTAAGSGTGHMRVVGNINDGADVAFTGSVVAEPVASPAGNTVYSNLRIENTASFSGTVANVCVADVAGECEAEPAIGGATSTIEQTQQNLGFSTALFMASMIAMVWFMRKH